MISVNQNRFLFIMSRGWKNMPGEEKKGVLGKVPKKSMESFSNSEKFPIPYFFF